MKRLVFLLGTASAFLILFSSLENRANAHTQYMSTGVRVGHTGFFYSHLRPYGEWIEVDPGFYAWRPVRVRAEWRPYVHGRWVWTDFGWYWVSYEPFGWAVFHYGRWYYDDYYGWIWIPDTIWGPAWVEWRYNDDYIGWAPLPPYASFSVSVGIRFTTRWVAPYPYWCFVRYRHFAATRIDGYVVDEGSTRRLIRTTRGASRYEVDRDRVINRGVDRTFIERRGNVRINRTEVGETRERGERILREGGRERIEAYRPSREDFERQEERIEARRPERRLSLDLNRIDRPRREEPTDRPLQRRETPGTDQERDSDRGRLERQSTPDRETPRERSRRESFERRTYQDRPPRSDEFRTSQPERRSIERTPERSGSPRREAPSVRTQPRRESTTPNQSQPRGRSERRGRNQ